MVFAEKTVVSYLVEVSGAHLLRQRARPAQHPLHVVVPPVEQPERTEHHSGDPHDVSDHAVVDVERRDVEDPERSSTQQQECDGVHVHVAEAEPLHVPPEDAAGTEEGEVAGGHVVPDVEQSSDPLWLAHHTSLVVHLQAMLPALTVDRVQSGEDRRREPETEEEILEPLRPLPPGVAPVEATEDVLREAGGVEEEEDDHHVSPFVRTVTSVLPIHLPELGDVLRAPSTQHHKLVKQSGVLVYAHEGEERVEDLVIDLDPVVPQGLGGEGIVEQSEEEEAEHGCRDPNAD
ncbi:hypothetical protein C4D60_Mb06t01030 [Musa balbisiana]|uniref:Uncharacterized protein n=1 Tax=Musa balbisiana TaxID=52838 RepID=A0A4S8IJT5_MUSBA|nr:hypothetical protein C4D60_Mb06t01030 [Musa balbisiana]